jgi:hypothetical protein
VLARGDLASTAIPDLPPQADAETPSRAAYLAAAAISVIGGGYSYAEEAHRPFVRSKERMFGRWRRTRRFRSRYVSHSLTTKSAIGVTVFFERDVDAVWLGCV